jgi:hypothetical protein
MTLTKKQTSAKVILHSRNTATENEIITFELDFWRPLAAEFNTHRMHSKNASSSRAIPFTKTLKEVLRNTFIPIAFQKSHRGMQGSQYLDPNKVYSLKEIEDALWVNLKFSEEDEFEDGEYLRDIIKKYTLPLLNDSTNRTITQWWLRTRDLIIGCASILYAMGVTKQICNRLLEPFMWFKMIVTMTEIENFFKQRCPQYEISYMDTSEGLPGREMFVNYRSRKDWSKENYQDDMDDWNDTEWLSINKGQAEIHMMALAEAMWDAKNESTPQILQPGEWHIPFGDKIDETKAVDAWWNHDTMKEVKAPSHEHAFLQTKLRIATARCARVSYLNFEGKDDYDADLRLFERLIEAKPEHWSPTEHCARAMTEDEYSTFTVTESCVFSDGTMSINNNHVNYGVCKNFTGFIQYRWFLENKVNI